MFRVGDRITHPMHGAGIVERIEEKELDGRNERYYVLRLLTGGLRLFVPVDSAERLGLRPISTQETIQRALASMHGMTISMESNWNRRYRENMERIRSGNIIELCRVIKGLSLREQDTGLSTGERKMLWSARQIMISEIQLAENTDHARAESVLAAALKSYQAE